MDKLKLKPYLMVSPYLVHFSFFVLFPVVFSIILMFHQWNIISPMEFVGLKNFDKLIHDRLFFRSIFNTLIFLFIHIPLQGIQLLGGERQSGEAADVLHFGSGNFHDGSTSVRLVRLKKLSGVPRAAVKLCKLLRQLEKLTCD